MSTKQQQQQASNSEKARVPRPEIEEEVAAFQQVTTSLAAYDSLPGHRTAKPLRQAAILQMQRRYGNAHVQRKLARITNGVLVGMSAIS